MLVRRSLVCTLLLATIGACSSPSDRSMSAYCTAVGKDLAQLNSPAIATSADIDATIRTYRRVAKSAPLAVEPEWETLVASLATAATVDVADPASVQRAADTAREAQPAAHRISTYTAERCTLQIGTPVATTTPAASTVPSSGTQPATNG